MVDLIHYSDLKKIVGKETSDAITRIYEDFQTKRGICLYCEGDNDPCEKCGRDLEEEE